MGSISESEATIEGDDEEWEVVEVGVGNKIGVGSEVEESFGLEWEIRQGLDEE